MDRGQRTIGQILTSLLDLCAGPGELDEDNVAKRLLSVVSDADGANVGSVIERNPLVLLGEALLDASNTNAGSKAGTHQRSCEWLGSGTDSSRAEKRDGGADSSEHFVQVCFDGAKWKQDVMVASKKIRTTGRAFQLAEQR